MTSEEAKVKAGTRWWENSTPREVVQFQLYEEKLCMPFGDFQTAVETVLGRPVWTHEFAAPEALRAEFEGKRDAPDTGGVMEIARRYLEIDA